MRKIGYTLEPIAATRTRFRRKYASCMEGYVKVCERVNFSVVSTKPAARANQYESCPAAHPRITYITHCLLLMYERMKEGSNRYNRFHGGISNSHAGMMTRKHSHELEELRYCCCKKATGTINIKIRKSVVKRCVGTFSLPYFMCQCILPPKNWALSVSLQQSNSWNITATVASA